LPERCQHNGEGVIIPLCTTKVSKIWHLELPSFRLSKMVVTPAMRACMCHIAKKQAWRKCWCRTSLKPFSVFTPLGMRSHILFRTKLDWAQFIVVPFIDPLVCASPALMMFILAISLTTKFLSISTPTEQMWGASSTPEFFGNVSIS
jgi:hypothetical protein